VVLDIKYVYIGLCTYIWLGTYIGHESQDPQGRDGTLEAMLVAQRDQLGC
jgi:hypothetical protein